MRYFDVSRKELIYLSEKASPEFWDSHWDLDGTIKEKLFAVRDTFVSKMTKNFLRPEDGIILEGGCGWGQYLGSLSRSGYMTIGLDYAIKTIRILKKGIPTLELIIGDVRKLPFCSNKFAGYWSLGVIEHFWKGYETIASEMFRVIKDGGYLFLTFPYMCPLRRIKGKIGIYDVWKGGANENFHQFALNWKSVVQLR
jgi:ubiquinone/menaquinone biosynthesis C-methylase UbiE